jgi:hypothetical protein
VGIHLDRLPGLDGLFVNPPVIMEGLSKLFVSVLAKTIGFVRKHPLLSTVLGLALLCLLIWWLWGTIKAFKGLASGVATAGQAAAAGSAGVATWPGLATGAGAEVGAKLRNWWDGLWTKPNQ